MLQATAPIVPIEFATTGQSVEIVDVSGHQESVCRLHEIGLSEGAVVQVIRPGLPCIVALAGRRISFRGENSVTILVQEK